MHPMTEDAPQTEIAIRETISAMERVHIQISPSSPPEKVREAVTHLAGHSVTVNHADKAVKFLMAQACMAVKLRKLYRVYGYKTNEAFIRAEVVRPGLQRSSVMKAVSAVKAWPDATAGRLASIPEKNLRMAAQIVLRLHLKPKQAEKVLIEAERMSIEEFADSHGREGTRRNYAVIRVVTSKSFKKEFDAWAGDDPEAALKTAVRRGLHRAENRKAA